MKRIIFSLVVLAVGFVAGFFAERWFTHTAQNVCREQYVWINKLFRCDEGHAIEKHGYAELRSKLMDAIDEKKLTGDAELVSVYFRDLSNGPVFGIGENTDFVPASLLKLPIMLAYLKLAEEDPAILSKQLVYEGTVEEKQAFGPKESIVPDRPYTIDTLLSYMIRQSDNRAYLVLLTYIHQKFTGRDLVKDTIRDLGLIDPATKTEATISVRSYASLFRILYNVSYLSKENSEKALALLGTTSFDQGIVASVPKGVPVAHKFGERLDMPEDKKQLHDCGIVYFPDNPYLLCIMTQGSDMEKLIRTIADVSRMVWEEVNSRTVVQLDKITGQR